MLPEWLFFIATVISIIIAAAVVAIVVVAAFITVVHSANDFTFRIQINQMHIEHAQKKLLNDNKNCD